MTAKELLKDLEECRGPCDRLCIYCPEQNNLKEIHDVVEGLIRDNDRLNEEGAYLTDTVQKLRGVLQEIAAKLQTISDHTYTYRIPEG